MVGIDAYQRLETEWAQFNELPAEGMVVCNSGTAALHLALEASGLAKKSYVVVPDYTMVACPRAVTLAGMSPVFVDCLPDKFTIDPGEVADACDFIGANKKQDVTAAMCVHVYGVRCEMNRIGSISRKYGLYLIEDMAEAHGVEVHKQTDAACWSFYRNKIVAGEEGGAVWFRDRRKAEHARELRSLGFTAAHDYTHTPRGHNYRMANALAVKVSGSIRAYPANRDERWYQWEEYHRVMISLGCQSPVKPDAPWVYVVRVNGWTVEKRKECVGHLNDVGITARFGFKPMASQEEYADPDFPPEDQPTSYRAGIEVFYLCLEPSHPRDAWRTRAKVAAEVVSRHLPAKKV